MDFKKKIEISDLVDEILLNIFKYLSILDKIRIERVCRRWLKLSQLSWQNVKCLQLVDLFEMENEFITVRDCNKLLISLLKRAGTFLRVLDVSDSNCNSILMDFNDKSVRAIGKYCPRVAELNLSYISLTNTQLKLLATYCNRVVSLKLVQCFEYELNADLGLSEVLVNMKLLKLIDFSLNDTFDGSCFDVMNCNALESAILNNCFKIKVKSLEKLAFHCPNLKRFELAGYQLTITTSSLALFTQLNYLNLNSYEGDASLVSVFKTLNSLKYLDIGHSSFVSDETMTALAQGCPLLETINLSGKFGRLSNYGFRYLSYCKHLNELDISWLENIDDKSLLKIAKNGSLRSLHAHLALSLTEEGLLDVIRMSPKLYFLDVTSCYQLGIRFLQKLGHYCETNRKTITVHVSADQTASTNVEQLRHKYFQVVLVV